MEKESGLFTIRFNDQGKKYIRKFVSISYTIFVLVFFEGAYSIYWNIKLLLADPEAAGLSFSLYERTAPYVSIFLSLMALVSNFYYVRFPRVLLRRIELNDEQGANKAFGLLFRGALVFLAWLALSSVTLIWGLTFR